MKNVLFIAGLGQRYYYDAFITASVAENLQIFVFDPNRLPKQACLNVSLDKTGSVTGFIDVLKLDGDEVLDARLCIEDIDIAWYLREDSDDQVAAAETTLESRFSQNESRRAFESLLSTLPCKWVNRKETINRLSSNKFYQQMVALRCGLKVPPTLISNSAESVCEFSTAKNGLLLKTLGYMKLDAAGNDFLYSERFSHEELAQSQDAIRNCPIFAQEYIEKRYEYRVMAICGSLLTCRIDSQASPKTKTDWRHYDFEKVEHVQATLPIEVHNGLLRFMQEIELNYGAIDLIETPEGEFVFLEINPSGQWGWIEKFAGLPIPQEVAKMLSSL